MAECEDCLNKAIAVQQDFGEDETRWCADCYDRHAEAAYERQQEELAELTPVEPFYVQIMQRFLDKQQ